MKRNERGITLIALVVTIIVLLILAGISIAMLTGENGILNKARDASWKSKLGDAQDIVGLHVADRLVEYYENEYVGDIKATDDEYTLATSRQDAIAKGCDEASHQLGDNYEVHTTAKKDTEVSAKAGTITKIASIKTIAVQTAQTVAASASEDPVTILILFKGKDGKVHSTEGTLPEGASKVDWAPFDDKDKEKNWLNNQNYEAQSEEESKSGSGVATSSTIAEVME